MRVVIAGGGDVGELIARRLSREGNEITIVEQDAGLCAHLHDSLDAKVVKGDAASVRTLTSAGLAHAEMLIAVTNSDQVNLLACLVAQAQFDVRVKVARIRTHEVDDWRRICVPAGLKIDLMIHPETELAQRMLPVLGMPGISDLLEFAGGRVKLFGMYVEPDHWVAGKSVMEVARAGPPRNSLMAMIQRGAQVVIPHGGEVIRPDDHVYVLTRDTDFAEMLRFLELGEQRRIERAFIIGGKQLGILMAEELERSGVRVKLFERDAERCEKVAALLEKTVVVHGDGSDASTLVEENVAGVDAYLALTGDDEQNLISSMLARRLGAKKLVALLNRSHYLPIAQRLGIHTTVSPRLATVDRILQFVRKGRVQSVTTFGAEAAEAIELMATAGWRYAGVKLKDVKLPKDVVVGAVMREGGEVIVPRGDDAIEAGDRVIFFASETAVPRLEEMFQGEAMG